MKDENKTKKQLINELIELRRRVSELGSLEKDYKRSEAALRSANRKLRAVFDAIQDSINVVDLDFNLTDFNNVLIRTFDLPNKESILGHKCYEVLKGRKDICPHCAVAVAYRNKTAAYRTSIPEDEELTGGRCFEIFAYPILDRQGNLSGAVEFSRDITERRRSEQSLKESKKLFQTIVNTALDSIFIKDGSCKYQFINTAMKSLFGIPASEILGKSDEDLFGEDAGKHISEIDNRILQGEVVEDEHTKPVRGILKTFHVIKVPMRDASGKIVGLCGVARDITERKQAEEALREAHDKLEKRVRERTAELAKANEELQHEIIERKKMEQQLLQAQKMEAIGTLTSGISHEFNNIMTVILGYGKLLQIEVAKDKLLTNYVTPILKSAERAANLTQALLAFSRKQTINPRPVNLNEIINGMEKLLSRLIGEDIELSTILSDKDLTVIADSGQIEQVLMNLVTNARDAMPDVGNLTIRTEFIDLDNEFRKAHDFSSPGSYALLSVEDTGQGMDDKTRERIFDPFFTTKEVGKGTGLGLAMVYGIIEQHDGHIRVNSEPGKGTTFKIYLPLIRSKVEVTESADFPILKKGAETVLIAEDDVQVRRLAKDVLVGFGYKVMEAVDGEDAISVFGENKDKIQLLILDLIMPKKSGKKVYDEIKKIRPDVKAIFISGYNENLIHKKVILEEGLDFILKPFSPDELLKSVREILDK